MTNKTMLLSAIALAITTAGATLFWRLQPDASPLQASTQPTLSESNAPTRPLQAPTDAQSGAKSTIDMAQADEYAKRLAFDAEYRGFFDKAAALSPAEREAEAERLRKGLEEKEAKGELAAGESVLLQIALIRASVDDPAEQTARSEALIGRYQAASEAREKARAQQRSPQFERYKQEERRIVEEVNAMQAIPEGLSRNEYLRQRLQEAREQAYR